MPVATKSHREFFANWRNDTATIKQWKAIHRACHPHLDTPLATSAEWPVLKRELELLHGLYSNRIALENLSEADRTSLRVYSENLELLFVNKQEDIDMNELADIE